MASFYRSGSLVFGGGHVVLPLLQASVVPPGWISNDAFLAGYGAAQAVPGPLFTFSAYLGAAMTPAPNGWLGAIICLVAVFLPSFLLVFGALPFWAQLRDRPAAQTALRGSPRRLAQNGSAPNTSRNDGRNTATRQIAAPSQPFGCGPITAPR